MYMFYMLKSNFNLIMSDNRKYRIPTKTDLIEMYRIVVIVNDLKCILWNTLYSSPLHIIGRCFAWRFRPTKKLYDPVLTHPHFHIIKTQKIKL